MSEFHVSVVKLGPFVHHPNADSLDVTKVFDYTVVTRRGAFKEGDFVVYVPVDSEVPDNEEWHWLSPRDSERNPRFPVGQVPRKYRVIEAKKIRGVFSQGCLAPLPNVLDEDGNEIFWHEGLNVAEVMGITKYEPPLQMATGGDCEAGPVGWTFPVYTDIEGIRRHPNIIQEGEEVVITEKIHGTNCRFAHDGTRLWVGSHKQVKKRDERSVWWNVVVNEHIEEKLALAPMFVFFGEIYGQVQDLKYDIKAGAKFRAFDVWDVKLMCYVDHDLAVTLAKQVGIDWVPTLYRGPWSASLNELCEGKSTIADNVREGFVVKPTRERWNDHVGRVILKRHGEGYLLRKKK
jgi:RNA ligase (TIGR02306 family)